MSHVVIAAWDGGGAVPPTLDVARALGRRGHDVRVLADATLRQEVEAVGATFRPWTRAPQRTGPGREADVIRDWEARTPLGAFQRVRDRFICGPALRFAQDVLEEHARKPADVVVAEVFLRGPLLAAESAGIPRVALLTTVNCLPTPGVPPFGAGFLPASSGLGRARDRVVAAAARRLWNGGLADLNAARTALGLPPATDVQEDLASTDPILVLSPRALDFPGARPAAHVHHVGARLLDPAWAAAWTPPPGEGPLVLVALSSTYQGQERLLRRCAAAVAETGFRGVVTTGPEVDPGTVGTHRGVQVVASAPHGAVLQHARAVVTHGGHGTVVKALAHGLPLVVIPMGRDQDDVAARVAASGAGIRLRPSASVAAVAAATRKVLAGPAFARAASRLAAAIAADREHDGAADAIEALAARSPRGAPAGADPADLADERTRGPLSG